MDGWAYVYQPRDRLLLDNNKVVSHSNHVSLPRIISFSCNMVTVNGGRQREAEVESTGWVVLCCGSGTRDQAGIASEFGSRAVSKAVVLLLQCLNRNSNKATTTGWTKSIKIACSAWLVSQSPRQSEGDGGVNEEEEEERERERDTPLRSGPTRATPPYREQDQSALPHA